MKMENITKTIIASHDNTYILYVYIERQTACTKVTAVLCLQCLRQYVQLAIRGGAGSAITCPDPACKNTATLLDSEVHLSISLSALLSPATTISSSTVHATTIDCANTVVYTDNTEILSLPSIYFNYL